MIWLTYPSGFFKHQAARGRPTGVKVQESPLQVRVSISEEDMEQLRLDAAEVAPEGSGEEDGLRLVAKGTLSRIRMARAQLKPSRYSEED